MPTVLSQDAEDKLDELSKTTRLDRSAIIEAALSLLADQQWIKDLQRSIEDAGLALE